MISSFAEEILIMPITTDNSRLLIEAAELHAQLEQDTNSPAPSELIIVDLGKEDRYLNSHIPGAVLVTPAETQAPPPVPGLAPSDEHLTRLMQKIGLIRMKHLKVRMS